jgi:hypothetical protein
VTDETLAGFVDGERVRYDGVREATCGCAICPMHDDGPTPSAITRLDAEREQSSCAHQPHCVFCSDEEMAGPCFGGARCMAQSDWAAAATRGYRMGRSDAERPRPALDVAALEVALAKELVRVVEMESSGRVLQTLNVEQRARRWAAGIARRVADALQAKDAP